jgi:hypothetical protein
MVTALTSSSIFPHSMHGNENGTNNPGLLANLQVGLAGLTGFFLKKGLLKR